jgi:hypothetical protein
MYRVLVNAGFLLWSSFMLQSCADDNKKKEDSNPQQPATEIRIANTGFDAEPHLRDTDSIQVLYYDDPDGDSLRYSRYFRYAVTADTAMISQLLSGFEKPYNESLAPRVCRSEGKMFLFANEKELKTVYFSTRCDSCCYLYFIKDGKFLYYDLNESTRAAIGELQKQSIKP